MSNPNLSGPNPNQAPFTGDPIRAGHAAAEIGGTLLRGVGETMRVTGDVVATAADFDAVATNGLRTVVSRLIRGRATQSERTMHGNARTFREAAQGTITSIGDSPEGVGYNPLQNWGDHVDASRRPDHQVPHHPGRPGHRYEHGDPAGRGGMVGDGEWRRQVSLLANRRADRARRETNIREVHHQSFGHDISHRRRFWHGIFGGGALGSAQRQEARSARIIDSIVGGETPRRIIPGERQRTGRLVKTARGVDVSGYIADGLGEVANRVASRARQSEQDSRTAGAEARGRILRRRTQRRSRRAARRNNP